MEKAAVDMEAVVVGRISRNISLYSSISIVST